MVKQKMVTIMFCYSKLLQHLSYCAAVCTYSILLVKHDAVVLECFLVFMGNLFFVVMQMQYQPNCENISCSQRFLSVMVSLLFVLGVLTAEIGWPLSFHFPLLIVSFKLNILNMTKDYLSRVKLHIGNWKNVPWS